MVDDVSTDGTVKWVATHYPPVRLVRRPRNGGFCAAANAGLSAARGQFIQLLNNDTEVTPGWLEAGLAPFADPTVGSVAPWFWSAPTPAASIPPAMPTRWPAGPPSAATVSPPPIGPNARSKTSSPPADQAPFTGRKRSGRSVDSTRCWARITRTSIWASGSAGPAIAPFSIRVLPDPPRDLRHLRPRSPRAPAADRPQRGACLLVEPARHHLAAAILPHAVLLITQAGWRMARLRFIPFFLGKIDAVRRPAVSTPAASSAPTWPGSPSPPRTSR